MIFWYNFTKKGKNMKKAFTMVELIFVIVVIGILATIAIPKFSATRDDAVLTKAKTTVANLRSSLSSEVQRRMLSGNYTAVNDLGGTVNSYDTPIFDYFDSNNSNPRVLEYPLRTCKTSTATGCWLRTGTNSYQFKFPNSIGGVADFSVTNNRFECTSDWEKCKYLDK
jgi:general secretion pathway protein G